MLLLLVLAVGFLAAGASAASTPAREMACCPAGMEARAGGCAWLGAGDCCSERPAAPAPSNAAAPAAASLLTLTLPAPAAAPAALPACASHAQRTPRSEVLRL